MPLLDLPPEIFKHIVADLVDVAEVEGVWKLRFVCRSFDREISVHVLSALPDQAFNTPRALQILNQNIAYYIAYRASNARDVHPNVPAKIGQMAKYLQEKLDIETDSECWQLLIELCKGLGRNIRLARDACVWIEDPLPPGDLLWCTTISDDGIARGIWRIKFDMDQLSMDLSHTDKVTAALAIGNLRLIQETLNELSGHEPFRSFGSPIVMAVRMRNPAVLSAIIDFVASKVGKRAKRSLVLKSAAFNAYNALQEAIYTHQVAVVERLLVYLQTHVPKPNRSIYKTLIRCAIDLADADCTRAILCAVSNDQNRKVFEVDDRLFYLACKTRRKDCVKALLAYGDTNIDSGHMKTSPIHIAILSGSDPILGAAIDSGADINLSPCGRYLRGVKSTPIEYAIRKKKLGALSCLLSRGADIPPISTWPTHSKMYQILRKQKMAREECHVPELKAFKAMNDIERAAL